MYPKKFKMPARGLMHRRSLDAEGNLHREGEGRLLFLKGAMHKAEERLGGLGRIHRYESRKKESASQPGGESRRPPRRAGGKRAKKKSFDAEEMAILKGTSSFARKKLFGKKEKELFS